MQAWTTSRKQISNGINPNSKHNSKWLLENKILIKKGNKHDVSMRWQFVEDYTRQE
jgi:hypothetical protein